MTFDDNKKTLFVIGMEDHVEGLLRESTKINPENMLVLQIYGPEISQSHDDLIRDIIIAVYQKDVEEVFVVGTRSDKDQGLDINDIKTDESEDTRQQIQTLTYLFDNCMPEFPNVKFHEWIEGSKSVIEGIHNSVQTLRHHPLLPSSLRVHGVWMDQKDGTLSEIQIS